MSDAKEVKRADIEAIISHPLSEDSINEAPTGQEGFEQRLAVVRPGPVKGSSWRKVQSLEPAQCPSPDGMDEIRLKDLDTGREMIIPKAREQTSCSHNVVRRLQGRACQHAFNTCFV